MDVLFSRPRLTALFYASGLGIICCFLAFGFFHLVGLGDILPMWPALLLAVLIAALFGAAFSAKLHQATSTKQSFLLGVAFLLGALPLYDLGALYFMAGEFQGTQVLHHAFSDYLILYGIILVYSLIFIGSWLAIICGLASIGLNKILRAAGA